MCLCGWVSEWEGGYKGEKGVGGGVEGACFVHSILQKQQGSAAAGRHGSIVVVALQKGQPAADGQCSCGYVCS